MKKLLLSLLTLLCATVSFATDITTVFKNSAPYTAGMTLSCEDGGLDWTTTGKPNGFDATNERGIQFSKTSSDMTAKTTGTITKVVVTASSNGVDNTIAVLVGGKAMGETQAIEKTNNKEYTFTGSASGDVTVQITSSGETGKSVYVKQIVVTTDGEGGGEGSSAYIFTQTTTFNSGAKYLLGAIVGDKVLVSKPIADGKTYDYSYCDEVSATGGKIAQDGESNAYTFEGTADKFTIKDSKNRYIFCNNDKYTSFNVTDEVKEACYFSITFGEDGAATIKNNTTGKYIQRVTYKATTNEFVIAAADGTDCVLPHIYEFTGKEEVTIPVKTIAEIQAANAGKYETAATVYATSKSGALLGDGTGFIYLFDAEANLAVGQKVRIQGTTSKYNGFMQFSKNNGYSLKKEGTETVTYPEAEAIDVDAWFESPAIKYVKYAGKLTISTNSSGTTTYYNVAIDGKDTKGSLIPPTQEIADQLFNNADLTVYGYAIYTSSSTASGNFVNTIVTNVEVKEVAVKAPVFNPLPPSGTTPIIIFDEPYKVEITCPTEGATIWYGLDGGDEDENEYENPIELATSGTHVIKSVASKDGAWSLVTEQSYNIKASKPMTIDELNALGDMETWQSETIPAGWLSVHTGSSVEVMAKSAEGHTGNAVVIGKGAEDTQKPGMGKSNMRLASSEVVLAPGKYLLSFWAKAAEETGAVQAGYLSFSKKEDGTYTQGGYSYSPVCDEEGVSVVDEEGKTTNVSNVTSEWKQYFRVLDLTKNTEDAIVDIIIMNNAKSVYKDILFDDVKVETYTAPTAVGSVKSAQQAGAIYDLSGRRVEKTQKGIYVVAGKKVIK